MQVGIVLLHFQLNLIAYTTDYAHWVYIVSFPISTYQACLHVYSSTSVREKRVWKQEGN